MTKIILAFRSIANAPKKEDETYFTHWKVKFKNTVLSTCRQLYLNRTTTAYNDISFFNRARSTLL